MGYLFARSLRSVGVSAVALAQKPRKQRVHSQYDIYYGKDHTLIRKYVKECEVIVWMHSNFIPLKRFVTSVKGKRLAVFHGGSTYRNDPKDCNKIFNPRVFVSLIQTSNMLGLGAKNERWILPPVDTELIQPNYTPVSSTYPPDQRLFIGHYPSSAFAKNTPAIKAVMDKLMADEGINDRFIFDTDDKLVPWDINLRRIRGCDIYIESMSKEINGKVTDDWGVTALEAAASGCVTLSVFRSLDAYLREHGLSAAILQIKQPEDLEDHIRRLVLSTRRELRIMQKEARDWVERAHSLKVVGERLREALKL